LILREKFPQCFQRLDLPNRQPLKVGIRLDIVTALPELSPVAIGRAIGFYTAHVRYLRQCTEGCSRVDLDGQPAGAVTAAEAEHARNSLAQLAKRRKRAEPAPKRAPPPKPQRLTLAALKQAAARRKLERA
jgi:ProP effector